MPVSADKERAILDRYNLTSSFPTAWPEEADDADDTDTDAEANGNNALIREQSKQSANSRRSFSNTYRRIDRHASVRSQLSGTQKTARGEDSMVQKDEADPLGMAQIGRAHV